MRTFLCGALAAGMMLCAAALPAATAVEKKKSSPKSPARRSTVAASKTGSRTRARTATTHSAVSKRGGARKTPAQATWRNRQLAPTAERYKEIQDALAAKGYLKPEDATGSWNQNSQDALKKFQAQQNIESTGKINSLSLIALGLGPKRDSASAKSAAEPALTDR